MPKYVIERNLPGVGSFSPEQLHELSEKSCGVVKRISQPLIQWLHSYVTKDKLYCVYIAPNEELIREHARRGGFPAEQISEVKTMIDPTTSEALKKPMSAPVGRYAPAELHENCDALQM